MFVSVAVILPTMMVTGWSMHALSRLILYRYDLYIAAFDRYLGLPSFALGKLVWAHEWSFDSMVLVYNTLILGIWAIYAQYLWKVGVAESTRLLKAFVTNTSLAVPIYALIPVAGPSFAFKGFPFVDPGVIHPHLLNLSALPNGIPSVHMSTALLIAWYARKWRTASVLGVMYAGLTALATLSMGEHYVFDLLVALPYTVLIVWLVPIYQEVRKDAEVLSAA
jgi:PAP2 superfamily